MNINSQNHNLLGNQILPKSEDFCIWRPFYILVTMATTTILNCFNTPKAATYYGGYSYKVDHNMAPKPWILIPKIKIYLETKFRPNWRIFVFWRPFCTLVTMATVAILNLFNPPKSCHTLRWIFLQSFMKFDERNPKLF